MECVEIFRVQNLNAPKDPLDYVIDPSPTIVKEQVERVQLPST